jgi:hypothetical protein
MASPNATALIALDPQVELERGIAEAIREYENKSPRLVIGISLTRVDRKFLEVEALIVPKKRSR